MAGAKGEHMKVMIVGGGGREHAMLEKLRESPRIEKIYALPGNGGMAAHAECVPIRATDLDGIVDFAVKNEIDFAVIGPDDPLIAGVCDRLRANGIRCFGPGKAAAEGRCTDTAMRELKLPKYESWGNYANFLPMNIERMCYMYNGN